MQRTTLMIRKLFVLSLSMPIVSLCCTSTAQVQNVMTEGINNTVVQVEWDAVSGISTDAFSYMVTYGPMINRRRQCGATGNRTVPGDQTEADIYQWFGS